MSDYFEIDFIDVESNKSGDAISLRYQLNGNIVIHVVDGGFQGTGEKVIEHIRKFYGNPSQIDRVIVTHNDGDHAGGLRVVLEQFNVKELWMLRPWLYANEIIDKFTKFKSVVNLEDRLKEIYSNLYELEKIAIRRKISIKEPFQGARLGAFTVLAPTKKRYLELVVLSEKTPSVKKNAYSLLEELIASEIAPSRLDWGMEKFSTEETSAENEMSIVQYANLCDHRILLTGDAGVAGLSEAADYAPNVSLNLPGIERFQVPHHGSRRNVSTELLDRWLGPRLPTKLTNGMKFTAIVSSAKKDEDHPRKAVLRALIHRGAKVFTTEGVSLCTGHNAPPRNGWLTATSVEYPEEQEE